MAPDRAASMCQPKSATAPVAPAICIEFIFGILGCIGPEVDNLILMKRSADRLFGDDHRWSVLCRVFCSAMRAGDRVVWPLVAQLVMARD